VAGYIGHTRSACILFRLVRNGGAWVLVAGNRWRVRFDKSTYVIGGTAVAAAVVLGALAGALPGVLTAVAGLASAVLWQAATNHRAKLQATSDLLQSAERELAPPHADADSPAMYLRAEAAVVPFQQRSELATLRDWLCSVLQADIALVIGEGGSGKTRLALQLAAEAEDQYGFAATGSWRERNSRQSTPPGTARLPSAAQPQRSPVLARGRAFRMRNHDDREQNDAPNADRVRADCRPERRFRHLHGPGSVITFRKYAARHPFRQARAESVDCRAHAPLGRCSSPTV
jgi:hypothetical protein